MRLVSPFETSFGVEADRECILVRLEERGGEEGWGEVVASSGPWYSHEMTECEWYLIVKYLAGEVVGSEFDHPEDLWDTRIARVRGHNMAKAGIDMALWDLYARKEGRSLSKVIGGVKDRIECGVSLGIRRRVEDLLEDVRRYLELGYRRIKIKIKKGWDVDVVRRIREEHPEIPLQVDANAAYTLKDVDILEKLDAYNLLMIEQPLSYDDLFFHSLLAKRIKTPICLDESITSLEKAVKAFEMKSCRVINIKPGRVGGITVSKDIHDFCLKVGMPVWIGGMLETGVGRAHLVALASLPGVAYPSDISASKRYYERDIVEPEWTVEDGYMAVPKESGIGVEVLEGEIKKHLVKYVEIKE